MLAWMELVLCCQLYHDNNNYIYATLYNIRLEHYGVTSSDIMVMITIMHTKWMQRESLYRFSYVQDLNHSTA